MNSMRLHIRVIFPIAILLLTVGCRNISLTTKDNIEIYQIIIHRIYSKDNSFGKAIDIKYLYIVNSTNDNSGDPGITKQPNQKLSKEVMDGVKAKLTDLPPEVIWINGYSDVLKGNLTDPVKDGAIITLGNIRLEKETKVFVSISFHVSGIAGAGWTYILQKVKNEWNIIGNTGTHWVS